MNFGTEVAEERGGDMSKDIEVAGSSLLAAGVPLLARKRVLVGTFYSEPRAPYRSSARSQKPRAISQKPQLQLNNPPLECDGDRLGPIGDRQLPENTADVQLHRPLGDVERRRDLPISFSPDEQSQNIEFTR